MNCGGTAQASAARAAVALLVSTTTSQTHARTPSYSNISCGRIVSNGSGPATALVHGGRLYSWFVATCVLVPEIMFEANDVPNEL